jgi:phage N-6-adenine-methyltransferase
LKPISQEEAGIDKHLADRARKLTKADSEEFEQRLAEGRTRILDASERVRVDVLASGAHVGQNSGDNEWFTPTELIESARKVLGGIDLDPASSDEANKVVKAKEFYSLADDGLMRVWTGRVWMNPPYAQPLINQFADKLVDAYQAKTVTSAIVLVNNATETAWFRALAEQASAACFPNGRIRFWHPNKPSATPLQGQALLYLGPSPVSFHARFSTVGIVWVKP